MPTLSYFPFVVITPYLDVYALFIVGPIDIFYLGISECLNMQLQNVCFVEHKPQITTNLCSVPIVPLLNYKRRL